MIATRLAHFSLLFGTTIGICNDIINESHKIQIVMLLCIIWMVPQALEAMLPWRSGCGSIPISELCLSIYFLSSLGYYKMVGFTLPWWNGVLMHMSEINSLPHHLWQKMIKMQWLRNIYYTSGTNFSVSRIRMTSLGLLDYFWGNFNWVAGQHYKITLFLIFPMFGQIFHHFLASPASFSFCKMTPWLFLTAVFLPSTQ